MNNKLLEVNQIFDMTFKINIDKKIFELKKKYEKELENFKYINDHTELINLKNKYIKYVGINDLLYYGGIFYKTEKINNKIYIYLIDSRKKPWKIEFDNYYIFYNDRIRSTNDVKRNMFDIFLKNI